MSDAGESIDPEAVVDLIGALAYGQLTAFFHLTRDAERAPTLLARTELARLAVQEFTRYEVLVKRLTSMEVSPEAAMQPFVAALDGFHERTAPADWLEGLVKAYVGEGIAADFYREISAFLGSDVHALVSDVVSDDGQAQFVVSQVRAAIADDPRLSGRLALYGRRMVGEALSQAQRVAADRDALTSLLLGAGPSADLAELVKMFGRLTEAHSRRMARLGLAA
ncbi:MAG: ferritin-like fold-containing protein [Kineosporiaceae bacterium]